MKYIKALAAVFVLVLLDQWTKLLAVKYLMNTDGITLIPGVFKLYYLENRGSAFGLLQNQKTFFVIFSSLKLTIIFPLYSNPEFSTYSVIDFEIKILLSNSSSTKIA